MKIRSLPVADYPVDVYIRDIPPSAQKKFVGLDITLTREGWSDGVDFTLSDGNIVPNTALVVSFQKTIDDTNWLKVGSWTFPGGIVLGRDGNPRLQESAQMSFYDGQGQSLAENGDLRVIFNVLVPIRTAITARLLEDGD